MTYCLIKERVGEINISQRKGNWAELVPPHTRKLERATGKAQIGGSQLVI